MINVSVAAQLHILGISCIKELFRMADPLPGIY